MTRIVVVLALLSALICGALFAGAATAHPERPTAFPTGKAEVPKYRNSGPSFVVCKRDSGTLLKKMYKGRKNARLLKKRLAILKRCRFRHIQSAVQRAPNDWRILIMPGIYREEPSRAVQHNDPKCGVLKDPGDGHGAYADYAFHLKCPTSRNLIFVGGDSDDDGKCDVRCNLQMQGMGRRPSDVMIVGDRLKEDVIRADRADGFYLKGVHTDQAAFNGVDVVETNGFRLEDIVSTYNQNYGVLSFTSDNGLYQDIEAYGNGDSGIYPGSGPEYHCDGYGIEIRRVNSYGNVLGYSGTAGNGTYVHDSKFNGNSAGISDDSFASGHPGMPQDCSKWERNEVASNNVNFFTPEIQQSCAGVPFEKRPREKVCPQFQVPVGSGFILYGVNRNLIQDNLIYDNHRSGIRLFWVPGAIRGETGAAAQLDTSNGNVFRANRMSMRADGSPAPNGVDVFWDEQGSGNCWEGNITPNGVDALTSDPSPLPRCPGNPIQQPVNALKSAAEVPCASWNPETNQNPVGCTWFTTPPVPGSAAK